MENHQRLINKFVFLFFIILINSCSQNENRKPIDLIVNQTEKNEISRLSEPTIIWEEGITDNFPRRNFRIIDYDNEYLFVGRNFGSSKDRMGNTEPAFFVHSKKFNRWLKIKQVAAKKGIFGYSKKLSKAETQVMFGCSVYLGQAHLANEKFCDLPLKTSGSIAFPDKITLDTVQNEYVLDFFSNWKIEKVKTILRFKKEELDLKFSKKFKNKN